MHLYMAKVTMILIVGFQQLQADTESNVEAQTTFISTNTSDVIEDSATISGILNDTQATTLLPPDESNSIIFTNETLEGQNVSCQDLNCSSNVVTPKTDYAGYVIVPTFLMLGLSGNTLTIVVMCSNQFRHMTISMVLIALAVSDNLLIILYPFNKLFVRNMLGVDIRSLSDTGCKIFFLLFRSAKMTSSWFVVLICLERFIAVVFPLRVKYICTRRNIGIGIGLIYCFIVGFNGTWTIASRIRNGVCLPHYSELHVLTETFVIAGTFIYSIIPDCIMMFLTPIICYKLFQSSKLQKSLAPGNARVGLEAKRTTAMLLGVTVAYIILVTPISIGHVMSVAHGPSLFETKIASLIIYRDIVQIIELLNYSINFFLYVICNKTFRTKVKTVLCVNNIANLRSRSQQRTSTDVLPKSKLYSGARIATNSNSDAAPVNNS